MIRAEIVEHPGTEVPNWVNKCRAVLTNGPAIAVVALFLVAVVGVLTWSGRHNSLANSTSVQSQPVSGSSLSVTTADELPAQTQAAETTPATTEQNVGPAPASSRSTLQPTGSNAQNAVSGLTQAPLQTLQSAGNATLDSLQSLGL